MRTALLSIHEAYASQIFAGTKRYEYRTRAPGMDTPIHFFVYVPGRRRLAGTLVVSRVLHGAPSTIWRKTGKHGGITRAEFMAYFEGRETAYAYAIESVQEFDTQPTLDELRQEVPTGFHPPQYLRWLDASTQSALEAMAG